MKRWPALVWSVLVLSAGCRASSSSDVPAPASSCPPLPAVAADDTSKVISFRNDVMPVFAASCTFESCHGTKHRDRVFLGMRSDAGLSDGDSVPDAIRRGLLEPSKRAELALVVAGSPDESFLMFKLDGDFCSIESRCPDGCGEPMPKDGELLDVGMRNAIRRWIAEGALDN